MIETILSLPSLSPLLWSNGLLQDKDFGKQTLHKGHANPLAEVTTSLKTYQHFTLEKAYLGEDFFWAFTPVAGDFIRIRFFTPVRIERCVCVRSHARIHTYMACLNTDTYMDTHTHTCVCMDINTYTHAGAHTHTQIFVHMHTFYTCPKLSLSLFLSTRPI